MYIRTYRSRRRTHGSVPNLERSKDRVARSLGVWCECEYTMSIVVRVLVITLLLEHALRVKGIYMYT